MTAITASNSNFLKQSTEQGFLSATLLFRAAVELELREMVKIQKDNLEDPDLQKSDTIHRNRLQWLLVHIGCGKKFREGVKTTLCYFGGHVPCSNPLPPSALLGEEEKKIL